MEYPCGVTIAEPKMVLLLVLMLCGFPEVSEFILMEKFPLASVRAFHITFGPLLLVFSRVSIIFALLTPEGTVTVPEIVNVGEAKLVTVVAIDLVLL